jgi:hypothetical protein
MDKGSVATGARQADQRWKEGFHLRWELRWELRCWEEQGELGGAALRKKARWEDQRSALGEHLRWVVR